MYLVHRSATCFNQTWTSSGWPPEIKNKYIQRCKSHYICVYNCLFPVTNLMLTMVCRNMCSVCKYSQSQPTHV